MTTQTRLTTVRDLLEAAIATIDAPTVDAPKYAELLEEQCATLEKQVDALSTELVESTRMLAIVHATLGVRDGESVIDAAKRVMVSIGIHETDGAPPPESEKP